MRAPWRFGRLADRFQWTSESAILEECVTHTTARLHDALLEAPAVVKVFAVPELTDAETESLMIRMWKAEARSLLRLRASAHPGIVQVLAADVDVNAHAYFVAWEDNYAATLKDVLDGRLQSPFKRLHDKIECCTLLVQALLEMHSRGILHRDIRPETICVWRDQRRAALSQFGQSIFLNSLLHSGDGSGHLPLPSGTLVYAAPERCAYVTKGRGAGEGFQADIYSLGLVIGSWLFQKPPAISLFDSESSYDSAAHEEWLAAYAKMIRETFVSQDLAIQQDLASLVCDMIAFNARHRIRSAGELSKRWVELRNVSRQRILGGPRDGALRVVLAENRVFEFIEPAIESELFALNQTLGKDESQRYAQLRQLIETDLANEVTIAPNAYSRGDCLLLGRRFVYRCNLFFDQRRQSTLDHLLMVQIVLPGRPTEPEWENGISIPNLNIAVVSLIDQSSGQHINRHKSRGADDGSWLQLLNDVRQANESSAPEAGLEFTVSLEGRASNRQRRALTLEALRRLLKIRKTEAALRQYAYRLVLDEGNVSAATALCSSDVYYIRVEPATDVEKSRLEFDPALAAFSAEFDARMGLCDFLRSLAAELKPQVVIASSHKQLSSARIRALIDDSGDGENSIRLRIPSGHLTSIPEVGWLATPSGAASDGQELAALDRLANDPFKLDALESPAEGAVSVPEELQIPPAELVRLSESKRECLKRAVATFPLYVLKGPPGTGKTEAVTALVRHIFLDDPSARVLVCAQSHRPLDNLVGRISGRLPDIAAVRFPTGEYEGSEDTASLLPSKVRESLTLGIVSTCKRNKAHVTDWAQEFGAPSDKLTDILTAWVACIERDDDELWEYYLRGASLIGVSCIGSHQLARLNLPSFDWVIVEEAARAHATELLVPLTLGTRWFLLGDHEQFGPFRLNALVRALEAQIASQAQLSNNVRAGTTTSRVGERAKELANLFTYLHRNAGTMQRGELLECYRMHPDLVRLVGSLFYADVSDPSRSRLVEAVAATDRQHPFVASWSTSDWLSGHPIVTLDTSAYTHRRERLDHNTSHVNELEVEIIGEFLRRLRPQLSDDVDIESEFAVLTVYAEQRKCLRRALAPLGAANSAHTLMTYQGREARTVILSLVRSNGYRTYQQAIGTIANDQDLNVALSRAKELLVVIGDLSHFRAYAPQLPRVQRLLELLEQHPIVTPADIVPLMRRPQEYGEVVVS